MNMIRNILLAVSEVCLISTLAISFVILKKLKGMPGDKSAIRKRLESGIAFIIAGTAFFIVGRVIMI